jgi:hypothetical protein
MRLSVHLSMSASTHARQCVLPLSVCSATESLVAVIHCLEADADPFLPASFVRATCSNVGLDNTESSCNVVNEVLALVSNAYSEDYP